jgi:hypothetical protein
MKSLLALVLLVTSPLAHACPNMAGTWRLQWSANPSAEDAQVITATQTPISGGMKYDFVSTDATGAVEQESVLADGLTREQTESQDGVTFVTRATTTCQQDSVLTEVQMYLDGTLAFSARSVVRLNGNQISLFGQLDPEPLTEQARYVRQ